ncbi:hypothetical protein GCM10008018_09370 [Paenibacillus marchantiophytorum]|uniref:Uncharacterized protein n=1 Tax=Paenibacillus marchantiophytorum TaxID=1619310 RepID=A0ABQ2BSA3_9BACL|nr:hypothetical protein [Paenibacillus marchantiophytorum]GGI44893.1 hypothetical protein GCM10008018_09370 [Paenibacillus marchantiophytorum]
MEIVRTWLEHPTLVMELGQPAHLQLGDVFPSVRIQSYTELTICASVHTEAGEDIHTPYQMFQPGDEQTITFSGVVKRFGTHSIQLTLSRPGYPNLHDAFYYYVEDPLLDRIDQLNLEKGMLYRAFRKPLICVSRLQVQHGL